ncbi:MAG: hypothetical protein ACQEQF_08895 [Bacillota bacterium]
MIKNMLSDIMIALGIILIVFSLFFLNYDSNQKKTEVVESSNSEKPEDINVSDLEGKDLSSLFDDSKLRNDFLKGDYEYEDMLNTENNNIQLSEEYFKDENNDEEKEEVEVVIKSGYSAKKIAEILDENNILTQEDFMDTLVIFGVEKNLRPGAYTFKKNSNVLDVFSKIIIGR